MRHMLLSLAAAALAASAMPAWAQTADPAAGVVAGPQGSAELTNAIRERDRLLFEVAFNTCDVAALPPLLAREFEFVHDKWGTIARSPEEFVASVRSMCEGRARGENVRASRELVADSLVVYPIQTDGAIQIGEHRFYGLSDGAAPVLRETGRFFHHWVLEDGQWRLRRVYSYDHRPAETPH